MPIPVFRPTIKRDDMNSVLSCLVTDSIGPGRLSQELANSIAGYLGMRGGVCLASYYTALHIALEVFGLKPGDRVLISSLSPSIYLDVLADNDLVPLLGDVAEDAGTILPAEIDRLAEQDPALMIVHHTLGHIADGRAVAGRSFPVVEDFSHALGAKRPGAEKPDVHALGASVEAQGTLAVLSLAAGNIVTAGGGAAVVAADRRTYTRLKACAQDYKRHSILPDMNAALGMVQLKRVEESLVSRRQIATVYARALTKTRHAALMPTDEAENAFYSFPVLLADGMGDVQRYAQKNGVETRPAYRDSAATRDGLQVCRQASSLALRCLLFPLYPMLRKREVETIAKVLGTLP